MHHRRRLGGSLVRLRAVQAQGRPIRAASPRRRADRRPCGASSLPRAQPFVSLSLSLSLLGLRFRIALPASAAICQAVLVLHHTPLPAKRCHLECHGRSNNLLPFGACRSQPCCRALPPDSTLPRRGPLTPDGRDRSAPPPSGHQGHDHRAERRPRRRRAPAERAAPTLPAAGAQGVRGAGAEGVGRDEPRRRAVTPAAAGAAESAQSWGGRRRRTDRSVSFGLARVRRVNGTPFTSPSSSPLPFRRCPGCWLGGQLFSSMVVRKPAHTLLDELEAPSSRRRVPAHAARVPSDSQARVPPVVQGLAWGLHAVLSG